MRGTGKHMKNTLECLNNKLTNIYMKKLKKEYLAWKTSEDPHERFSYAQHTGEWEHLKTDKYWENRQEYAEHTRDWEFLKNDENEGNRLRYAKHTGD